jgi:ABC-type multidrug transport system fused ATPase/permease subunit
MVSPDLPLLRGTIESNLRYRWPDAPQQELRRVCDLCGIDQMLSGFPEGIRTRISDGGASLSLGQRQRIMLARALLGNPRILLLDEVDANLDTASANLLDRVLKEYKGTIIQISHRIERLRHADLIWHLDDGQIRETGAPAELLNQESATRAMFVDNLKVVA